ncbi:hypothetical protein QA641_22020 [Bradyrhizobium sp. CB1650]|uniref:hypothetical protein n=1 Tax=Bradyrhizobium sp. CB1650 TaxID=3039153 RepID=UPI002435721B|nr:hypothetical protein [Bradyrhizobium sp. CB1650]WGD56335.1 hypothetical protein QA641_22020 [Bradyrhizobium sp. CB1650]
MRKHIVAIGAVAAVGLAAPRFASRASPVRSPPISRLSPLHQATMVAERFRHARTAEQFEEAEKLWSQVRPSLTEFEGSLNCSNYGAAHDREIANDLAEQVLNKPIGLMIDTAKLVLAVAGAEQDEAAEDLKEVAKDLEKLATDEVRDAALEKVGKIVGKGNTAERFKEALLRFLQSKSKRSRQHFLKIINDVGELAKGYGGLALKYGEIIYIALSPSRINPEECGIGEWVEHERSEAIRRVFSSEQNTQPGPLRIP